MAVCDGIPLSQTAVLDGLCSLNHCFPFAVAPALGNQCQAEGAMNVVGEKMAPEILHIDSLIFKCVKSGNVSQVGF